MKPKETLATLDMEIRACQTELHALCGLRDAFLQLEKAIRRNGTGPIAPAPETPKPAHHMQTPEAREKQRRAMKAYWRRKRAGRV